MVQLPSWNTTYLLPSGSSFVQAMVVLSESDEPPAPPEAEEFGAAAEAEL